MGADNKKKESRAVDVVSNAFGRCFDLDPMIAKNDKEPAVDGCIQVFKNEVMTKERLEGKVPVQVKATTSKRFRESKKFPINIDDLNCYKNVYNGVLYFVVYLNKETLEPDVGIFYKRLLPYDIDRLLKTSDVSGKQTIAVRFDRLPKDPRQLSRICHDFVRDSRKQSGAGALFFADQDELHAFGFPVDHYEFSNTVFPGEEPISLKTMENGMYLYAVSPTGQMGVVNYILPPFELCREIELVVRSGDYEERFDALVEDGGDKGRTIRFGGFSLGFESPGTLKYTSTGSIRECLRDARLFKNFCDTGKLSINGYELKCKPNEDAQDRAALDEGIAFFERVCELLDALAIKVDWDPNDLTDKDWHSLRRLYAGFIEGKHIGFPDAEDRVLNVNIDIAGSRIKAIASRQDDGKYELLDPAACEMVFVPATEAEPVPDPANALPAFFLCSEEDYRLASNIDVSKLDDALLKWPISVGNCEAACDRLLLMLHAYDDGAVCSEELLACCLKVAEALVAFDSSSEYYRIDLLQVKLRAGTMTQDDLERTREMAVLSVDKGVRASALLILGQFELAYKVIDTLEEDALQCFKSWPIYNLLEASSGTKGLPEPNAPLKLEAGE